MSPRLSVIVVTYDSAEAVARCMPRLVEQLAPGDELIVVDNASRDGTLEAVSTAAPAARVLPQPRNLGFAAGANAGAAAASGDLLLFLNPDAEPAAGFVEAIKAPARVDRGWAAWMGLVTMDGGGRINTSGGVIHFTGIAWSGEARRPVAAAPAGPTEVAFLSGTCLALPRSAWERLGGFPEEFFMYCEDVDLSLRARLAGGRLGVEPAARVDHDYDFAKGAAKWRRLERNRWAVLLRDYPGPLLGLIAPALLATEVALLAIAAAGGWLPAKLLAWGDTLRSLPRLRRERRAVQATRTISAAEFAGRLTPDLDSAYLGRAATLAPLRWSLRAYWHLVVAALSASEVRPRERDRS
ncbi:MAG TPA: glycosyltransferase family 2 protein [Solirubrobacteraceae bacterium]|nr:glycosyltransferase family 2 protein [Solirubrobacteraceae bacterium]